MKLISFFLPRIEYILFAAIFWGITASGPKILNFDGDLPRHLLVGNLILQTREIPLTDLFSYRTIGYPSIPHEWLAQVIFAISYGLFGLNGVVLLTALIVTATWGIVFYQSFHRSGSLFASLVFTGLAVGASQIHLLPRPHLFTYILTAIWIVLLERIKEGRSRTWWILPLLMLIWVNLHGMFVLGLIIWGIYLIGNILENPTKAWLTSSSGKSLLFGGALAILATFFSPSGMRIWEAITSLGSNAYITSRIPEYQSPNFHFPETWPFVSLLLLLLIGIARTTHRIQWTHIFLSASFVAMALYTSRMIPLFAIVVTPIVSKLFADWIRNEYPQNRYAVLEKKIMQTNSTANGLIWIVVVVLSTAILLQIGKTIDPENKGNIFDHQFFPVEAANWLETHPQPGHMFNEFDWGGYLLFRLWPNQQIFMDGHTHIYREKLTREYERVTTLSPAWKEVFEKYQIEWVIVRVNAPLAEALRAEPGWSILYQDDTAIILRSP